MSGPWFLISLFVAEILLYIFINKLGNKKSVIVCFVLGIIGTTYMTFMSTYLPWSIDATCISIVYVYLGYQFKLHFIDECRKDHSKYAELTAMIVLASINIISCILNFKFTGAAVDLYATVLGNPILYWIESISGTFSLILLIIMVYNFLPKRVRMLFEKCGSCTILLYMAHGIIFDLLNRILLYSGVYYESFGMVSTFCLGVCYVAFATLLLLLAYKPLSNYCPLVVGVLKRN